MFQIWIFLACQTEKIEPPPPKEPAPREEVEEEEEEEEEENSPPVIRSAAFTSPSPTSKEELRVETVTIDQDGDRVRMDYEWSINGKGLPSERRAYLDPSWFKSGDTIQVRIIASDSKVESDTTIQTTIQNTPPRWVRDPRGGGKINGLRVEAVDPDGGSIIYKLEGEPAGEHNSSWTHCREV